MQKKKHRKVNFRINHCSSQDSEYPVTQLLLQSPDAKGWQSKRFSSYPQIIIIQLVQLTLLRQISLLSHQSKIATKIQIQAKLSQGKDWKKLGYVSLTSNQNTNFQARQLRTANLNGIPANLIKLVLKTNHINSQNIFNQVGLISLSVYGDKMVQSNFQSTSVSQGNKQITNTLELDKQTLSKLKQLQLRKKQAVDNQQFDVAKKIKEEIQRIKNIGQTLILLQQKKQQAIKKQDYQTAKVINEQMKKMRDQNQCGPNISNKPSGNPAQFLNKQKTQSHPQQQDYENCSPVSNQQNKAAVVRKQVQIKNQVPQKRAPQQQYSGSDQRPLNNGENKKTDMEDRPLDTKGSNRMSKQFSYEQQPKQGGGLQPLSKEIFAECQQFFNVIEEQVFCHIYSKDHKNRESGMRMIKDKLNQRITDRQTFIQAMLFAVKCTIDDRIASVLTVTLEVFYQFLRKVKPTANSNNLEYAEYIIEKICDYLGHTNSKIFNVSESILSNLPVYQLTNKDICYKCLTMIHKREKPPKIVAGKLKMIAKIVTEYQLGNNYEDVVNYVVRYLDDKNNDVRGAAMNAICAICNQTGYNTVQPFLKNIRPQITKAIQQQIQSTEGDNRNFDERPIKPKNNTNNAATKNSGKQRNQIESVDNQFIGVTRNNAVLNQTLCPFCKKADQRFVQEDYLDMHMFHSCPMLTICLECKQTIEISTLTSHLVGQCQNSKYLKKCPRCKQAVHQKIFKTHVQKKQCLSAKPMAAANRCPLCHLDISPGVNGWKQHLVDQGCEKNPRK